MGRRAWKKVEGGDDRPITNTAVREWMGLATVKSELRSRRLKWWVSITQHTDDNAQLLAALFSPLELEETKGIRL